MIILDTNVVSEAVHPSGSPKVRAWLDAQATGTLFLTTTVLSELLLGVELLPQGKRRELLGSLLDEFVNLRMRGRVLAFDEGSARAYALLVSRSRLKGKAISIPDGQIAAIAHVHGFSVATRDVSPFVAAGVAVIDPWKG